MDRFVPKRNIVVDGRYLAGYYREMEGSNRGLLPRLLSQPPSIPLLALIVPLTYVSS